MSMRGMAIPAIFLALALSACTQPAEETAEPGPAGAPVGAVGADATASPASGDTASRTGSHP